MTFAVLVALFKQSAITTFRINQDLQAIIISGGISASGRSRRRRSCGVTEGKTNGRRGAGFRTGFVSGSSVSAMRLAVPDMDLVSFNEMADAVEGREGDAR